MKITFLLFSLVILMSWMDSPVSMAEVRITNLPGEQIFDIKIDRITSQIVTIDGRRFLKFNFQGVDGYDAILYGDDLPDTPVIRFFVQAAQKEDVAVKFVGTLTSYPNHHSWRSSLPSDEIYSVESAGSWRGVPMQLVTIYPLTLSKHGLQYEARDKFQVVVKSNLQKTVRQTDKTEKDVFAFVVGQQFVQSKSLMRYVNYKRQHNFDVRFIFVSPHHSPQSIRQRLQELYRNSNLRYALIVGDINAVPSPEAGHLNNEGGVTDHYYSAIDTDDYESDINGPDIAVGRVPVATEEELAPIIDKFIRYQEHQFKTEGWLKKASFIASDDKAHDHDVIAEKTHEYVISHFMKPAGYTGNFSNCSAEGGDRLYAISHGATSEDVMNSIADGRSIIVYSGHGDAESWCGPGVTVDDLKQLPDNGAYPFVISNACLTARFYEPESFGEAWIKNPHGAIMFWGSMDYSSWHHDDILERKLFANIFNQGLRHFGDMTVEAQKEIWRYYGGSHKSKYYWETYVTLGDPSIELAL